MRITRREFLSATAAAAMCRTSTSAAEPQLPIVDCHTHFYDPGRPEGVPWPGKSDDVLYRTILPKHFLEQAAPLGVTKTVIVEASPWVEDNAWLLDLAAKNPSVLGIVGNLTPGQPDFAKHLKRFAANKRYRGIRINHGLLKMNLDKQDFLADIARLAELDLELDVNGGPDMPADVAPIAEKLPDLRIVINHLGNVDVDGLAPPATWRDGMTLAAKRKNVFCKVSALVEHAKPKKSGEKVPADVEFYRPVLDAIWSIFGDDRLIYGSNWPVSDRAASYRILFTIVKDYVTARGQQASAKFFWKNAQAAYRWPAE